MSILLRRLWLGCLLLLSPTSFATIEHSHGYAQFADLKYPADFSHFDWVNPKAPKGGQVQLMALGTFDTLNPYTLKGSSPISTGDFASYGVSELNAPLMIGSGLFDPSGDEPASAYGLVAESLEYSQDRSWVTFFYASTPPSMMASRLPQQMCCFLIRLCFTKAILNTEQHYKKSTALKCLAHTKFALCLSGPIIHY